MNFVVQKSECILPGKTRKTQKCIVKALRRTNDTEWKTLSDQLNLIEIDQNWQLEILSKKLFFLHLLANKLHMKSNRILRGGIIYFTITKLFKDKNIRYRHRNVINSLPFGSSFQKCIC